MKTNTYDLESEKHGESGYLRCLSKAMDRTHQLLRAKDGACDHDRVHTVKSILYAAIEQAGMESERLLSAQELLRELLMLVALQADPLSGERQEALKILETLRAHHSLHPKDPASPRGACPQLD